MAAKKKSAPKKTPPKAKKKPPAANGPTSRARVKAAQAGAKAAPRRPFDLGAAFGVGSARARDKKAERIAQLRERAVEAAKAPPEDAPPAPGPESEKDDRIAHCVALMSRLLWFNYETRVELAGKWGVSESTVRDYAAEASRQLRVAPEDVEAEKLRLARACEDVQGRARTTFNEQTGMPDFGAELKAIEMTARFRGVLDEEKKKIELTGKDGGPIETKTPTIFLPQEISGE